MSEPAFAAARDALIVARQAARPAAALNPAQRPADLDAAGALQAAVLAAFGDHAAWKVGGVTEAQRAAMGVAVPVAAAIPRAFCRDAAAAPAELDLTRFIAPLVECEIAFRLGRDLPPRPDQPYTRAEVEAAIASMHPAIEIVDPRLPAGSDALSQVADGFNNGALVVGAAFAAPPTHDVGAVAITLRRRHDGGAGDDIAAGSPSVILDGDPLGCVVLLANAQPAGGPALRAGDVVTTGSCTGAPRLPGPGTYRAEYAGLGAVEVVLR